MIGRVERALAAGQRSDAPATLGFLLATLVFLTQSNSYLHWLVYTTSFIIPECFVFNSLVPVVILLCKLD